MHLDVAEKFARHIYFDEHVKELCPLLHLTFKDGTSRIIGLPFSSRDEKYAMAQFIIEEFSGKVKSFVFICEAWALSVDTKNEDAANAYLNQARYEYSSFGEHPDRVEICTMIYEDASGAIGCTYDIVRDKDGYVKELTNKRDNYDEMKDYIFSGLI